MTEKLPYSYLITWRKEAPKIPLAWTTYSETFRSFKEAWDALNERFEEDVITADLDLMVGNLPDGNYWQLLATKKRYEAPNLSRAGELHLSLVL